MLPDRLFSICSGLELHRALSFLWWSFISSYLLVNMASKFLLLSHALLTLYGTLAIISCQAHIAWNFSILLLIPLCSASSVRSCLADTMTCGLYALPTSSVESSAVCMSTIRHFLITREHFWIYDSFSRPSKERNLLCLTWAWSYCCCL